MRPDPETLRKMLAMHAEQGGVVPVVASEKGFMAEVLKLARRHGWLCMHQLVSKGTVAGYPDLTMIRGPVLVAAELKVGDNRLTAAQSTWLESFAAVREVQAFEWRPERWVDIERALRA